MVRHHLEAHSTLPFAVTNGNCREKCAFCEYIGNDLLEHLLVKHKETLKNPQSGSLLKYNGYIQISISNLDEVFAKNNENVRFICRNNHMPIILNREDVLSHLQEHGIECSCKQFHSKSLFDFLVHQRDVHYQNDFEKYLTDFQNWLKKEFQKMGAFFQDGLIFCNGSLNVKHFKHFHNFQNDLIDFTQTLKLEMATKYVLKIITCYMGGENVKNIFSNLCRRLGLLIERNEILKIERDSSKTIVIQFRNSHIKERVIQKLSMHVIWLSDLLGGCPFPPKMNTQVQFEF